MIQTFKNGQTSVILRVKLLDSSSTTGAGLTGLTSASSGLIISTIADNESTATAYTVAGSTIESITTLGTYATPTATKCRFKEVDSTNHKGIYEFQFADARFAVANAKSLIVSVLGATNLQQADFLIQLQSDDPYVAKPTNSSLLSIDANGRVDAIKIAGTTQTARDIGASVLLSNGTGAGQISLSSGAVTVGTNNDKTGYTASTVTDKTGYALTAAYDAAKTAAQAGDAMALTSAERNSTADAFLNRDMSVGTDSGSPTVRTVRQALRFLRNKFAIVAGTMTVYKEDDTTSSWTSTIATTAGNPISSSDPA